LKATLTAGERTQLERRPTNNAEAYEYYLRARVLQEGITIRSGRARYEELLALYEKAGELDPRFALAHAGATHANCILYAAVGLDPTPERRARAGESLRRAEAAAPTAPETALARAEYVYFVEGNRQDALGLLEAARAGLPNNPNVLALLGFVHRRLGHWQEAVDYLERALSFSPNDLYNLTQLTRYLLGLRRYEECLRRSEVLVRQAPNDGFAQETLIRARFALTGDRVAHAREFATIAPSDWDPHGLAIAYQAALRRGDWAAADRALTDPRQGGVMILTTVSATPLDLLRAQLAWVNGRESEARALALAAIAELEKRPRTLRWNTFELMLRARAEALAGRRVEALRDGRAALEAIKAVDAYLSGDARVDLARIHLVLGDTAAALELLAEIPSVSLSALVPPEWPLDPILGSMNGDPRFDAVIRSIKAL
ncbi:MAG: tetratricopeptide repeat protein, partial [Opitutaceae bacterium]